MTATLVLPESIADELTQAASSDVESGGVLLARHVETPSGNVRLLGREMHWVPDEAYEVRSRSELVVASDGFVPYLRIAEDQGSVPIWLHTHPGQHASPQPSHRDAVVNRELADLFRLRSDNPWYGAVVIASTDDQLRFTGHIESVEALVDIDRMWIAGARCCLVNSWTREFAPLDEMFDRSIRAFGGAIQSMLADLRIAVVGTGGTGSAVVEQLVRLGVRHLSIFDPDELSLSNVTRVYGSSPKQVGMAKVDVMAAHIERIAPGVVVESHRRSITEEQAARRLIDADVIFGCTDDNVGRLVLSRIATYFMTPVIDCGVLLSADSRARIDGIDGRITFLGPGAPCLLCRERIDLERAAAEALPSTEQERLAAEGYAPALGNVEPAVVAYTTHVASAAVCELLERLIHYGPTPTPSEVLLRMHEREISVNSAQARAGHYCHPDSGQTGRGMTEPFLEQVWHY